MADNCTSRFAEAWELATFWCIDSLIAGADDSGGAGNASLSDSGADFVNAGIVANVGMILYNVSDGSNGPVTVVTDTTLTATLTGGTTNLWDNGDAYRIVPIDAADIMQLEHYLDIAASDIHAALAASGACDCTLASWGLSFLKKLNIIDAETYYNCPCRGARVSETMRQKYIDWMDAQMELIRTGKLELCAGETGSDFPSLDWADQGVTEFAAAKIISNDIDRNS